MTTKLTRVTSNIHDAEARKLARLAKAWRLSLSATVEKLIRDWGRKQ